MDLRECTLHLPPQCIQIQNRGTSTIGHVNVSPRKSFYADKDSPISYFSVVGRIRRCLVIKLVFM